MSNSNHNSENKNNSSKGYARTNEFKEGVTDEFNILSMPDMSRRKFLALMSASAAFGLASCSDYSYKEEIMPYNKRPERTIPGIANYYASTCDGCSKSCGVLVKTREGRPVKLDGNEEHPINKGKICASGQASILNLYDPDRLKAPMYEKKETSWEKAGKALLQSVKDNSSKGAEIAVITNRINSPSEKKVFEEFKAKYPAARFYSYEYFGDNNKRDGWEATYGTRYLPNIKLREADVVVSLESDFLGKEGFVMENSRNFSARRDVSDPKAFMRLYAIEGNLSLTGMNADKRASLRPDKFYGFVNALKNSLRGNTSAIESFATENKMSFKVVADMINDLRSKRGIILAGDQLPAEVHAIVNEINNLIGAESLYDWSSVDPDPGLMNMGDWNELIGRMNAGQIGLVIHYGTNPVYHLPPSLNYAEGLEKITDRVAIAHLENETSALCGLVLPMSHFLESWGDASPRSDVYSLRQPVINPIFNSRQKEAVLLSLIEEDFTDLEIFHKYLYKFYEENVYPSINSSSDVKSSWFAALHDGALTLENSVMTAPSFSSSASGAGVYRPTEGVLVKLNESYFVKDGRFSNNGWAQELPHPVTKITWDNYAAVSPNYAKKLNVEMGDIIKIEANGKDITVPVLVQPGAADDYIEIEMGYGRWVDGAVGLNVGAYAANIAGAGGQGESPYMIGGVKVTKTGDTYELASTQEHHALDDNFTKDFHLIREIIRHGTVDEYINNPDFIKQDDHEPLSITKSFEYGDVKWGMTVDLNKCTGCAACVTSCNVENNIPVVGKDQVLVGREMTWMRIDRYYSGTPEDPITFNQPMLCQHCDNAPCENVCPVNATQHSPDGINQMVYNRCVGTRYCSNNCPYKVRRFNFFNFRDHFRDSYYENELTGLMHNPEVTVRSRGVMEKCTFCIQRIMDGQSEAIAKGLKFDGTGIKSACQEACPTTAIKFGNVNNPETDVHADKSHDLGYGVLKETNVRPNVTYIAKLRNTETEVA